MSDLAAWLLERIAEDEAAVAAILRQRPSWTVDGTEVRDAPSLTIAFVRGDYAAEHIARWDPARVVAECEAKRRIVTRWEFAVGQASNADEGWEMIAGALEDCVCDLALPYADHPTYREEWRP